jgi:hypothetical protein
MIRKILILVALIIIKVVAFANSPVKDTQLVDRLVKLADYGNRKLKNQVARNTENDKKNQHQFNNYIIDFSDFDKTYTTTGFNDLSPLLAVGGSYVGVDVLNAEKINELNTYLLSVNNTSNTDIYIAVNLRLGLIMETKEVNPELLNDIDNEAASNNIAKVKYQNYQQVRDNHAAIKTYFDNNLAAGVSGDFVLFTWGKYYKVAEVPTATIANNNVALKLYSGGHYRFYYDHASSITTPISEKITAYVERATDFSSKPRKTSAELVDKYKTVIDGLKEAIANSSDLDKFFLEGVIKQNDLKKVGKQVLTTYYYKAKGEGALDKLVELAIYVEKFDTAVYNGYVNGVRDDFNRHNYWFIDDVPEAGGFNKDNIANILEKIKDHYDAFLIIKDKAKNDIITKNEFKEYFNKYLV